MRPLLIFVLLTFVAPIVDMLFRSVENGIVEDTLPKTVIALQEWDPTSGNVPDEVVFAALYDDLVVAVEEKTHTRLGSRLNYEETGVSSLFRKTGRGIKRMDEAGPYKEQFIDLDKDWGQCRDLAGPQTVLAALYGRLFPECLRRAADRKRGSN